MAIRNLMRRHVVTAEPNDIVDDTAAELRDAHVGCAVVVEGDHPVGVVTDRDICVRLDANWLDTAQATVGEVMSSPPITVDVDADVLSVSETMAEHGIRRIPVVEDESLIGIVTQDDLIVLLSRELRNLAGTIEEESPPEPWGRAY